MVGREGARRYEIRVPERAAHAASARRLSVCGPGEAARQRTRACLVVPKPIQTILRSNGLEHHHMLSLVARRCGSSRRNESVRARCVRCPLRNQCLVPPHTFSTDHSHTPYSLRARPRIRSTRWPRALVVGNFGGEQRTQRCALAPPTPMHRLPSYPTPYTHRSECSTMHRTPCRLLGRNSSHFPLCAVSRRRGRGALAST